ncbi:hypothetical protein E1B28_010840 [Marasmius oreades]|uniref:DUF6533 domain-containing protein n=1 Tax=Marasmius oreades TaxID=181124 RepID=A0A9P7UNX6_9AGAR|nr:uncharacterized protein E1B28_010840 [Marasmius oreades]KAG7089132.1 hypothetical protein E1B28_010840 [Marasmius oreades]
MMRRGSSVSHLFSFATMVDPHAGTPVSAAFLSHQHIVTYMDVVSAALLAYDVIIKLDVEIEHIWMRKWSFLTVVYIIQRYLPFIDTMGLVLDHHFGAHLNEHYCTLNFNMAGWCYIVGMTLSQVILTIRVWAVWNRSVPVAVGFVLFFLGCWVPCYVLLGEFSRTGKFGPDPSNTSFGCYLTSHPSLVPFWALWLVYDSGTFMMILIPGLRAYRGVGRSELLKAIYQDGVAYYVFMFSTSLANMIGNLILPYDLTFLLFSFARVIHSLVTSRVLLHIRQVAWERSESFQMLSQIRFTQNGHEGSCSVPNRIHDRFEVSEFSTRLYQSPE